MILLMRLSYLDVAVLGSLDRHDMYDKLEQNVFNKHYLLEFDDNKVLKIVNWIC